MLDIDHFTHPERATRWNPSDASSSDLSKSDVSRHPHAVTAGSLIHLANRGLPSPRERRGANGQAILDAKKYSSPTKSKQPVTDTSQTRLTPPIGTPYLALTPPLYFPVTLVTLSMAELQGTLPTLPSSSNDPSSDDIPGDKKEASLYLDKSSDFEDADEKPQYVKGEPVINSGRDVSRYLVDLRDDQDPPITFRSIVLGTVIGGLGAALYQVCCV